MKMVQFKSEINEIVNISCYLTLFSLGLYWIFTGDALNKYFLKRTNFAEFSEPMDRIPTILTWIDPIDGYRHWNYEIGKDYNITFASEGYIKPLNLTVGRNMVPEIGEPNVSLLLASENHWLDFDLKYPDGSFRIALKDATRLTVFPQKYIHLKSIGNCQDELSLNDLWLHNFVQVVNRTCNKPCWHPFTEKLDKKLGKIVAHLPICRNEKESCRVTATTTAEVSVLLSYTQFLRFDHKTSMQNWGLAIFC